MKAGFLYESMHTLLADRIRREGKILLESECHKASDQRVTLWDLIEAFQALNTIT